VLKRWKTGAGSGHEPKRPGASLGHGGNFIIIYLGEQSMNTLIRNVVKTTQTLSLLTAAILIWPNQANAQGAKSLEGTWNVSVTLRNCESGAAIRSFPRMITFAKGGTLAEFAAAGTEAAPVARAPGQGAWEYLGAQSFTYSLKFMRLTPFGGPDGYISEMRILDISESGDGFTADGVAVITCANGAESPQLCATEEGLRIF